MDTSIIWVVFACFLAVLIVITLWSRRESNSMQGYYLAGKQLPWWVVAGEVIGIALSWMVVARRLKRATDEYGSITVPDYLESRFNDHRHVLRLISIAIILLMVGAYAAAQMVAAGKAFGTILNLDSWVLFFKESAYELYEMVPAFFAAMLATVLVSLATRSDNRRLLLKL